MDFCYPPVCVACDGVDDIVDHLCPGCMGRLNRLRAEHACSRCAMPIPVGAACAYCKDRGLPPYQQIVRLGVFQEPLRALIHRAKYQNRWPIAELLAEQLTVHPVAGGLLERAECIVPVPLHWKRQWERGYNQSHVLACRLARVGVRRERGRARVVTPVIRLRDTQTQTMLPRTQRIANLRGAFALLRPAAVAGKHVVVVDDVMTSGATLQSLGRVLAAGRPASLCAVVAAIADPRGQDSRMV